MQESRGSSNRTLPTVAAALRRPWALPPAAWITILILIISFGALSIDPQRITSPDILVRAIFVTVLAELFIQLPILVLMAVPLLRLRARIGLARFCLIFLVMLVLALVITSGGEIRREPMIELFIVSVFMLPFSWVGAWLFAAGS